MRAITTNNGTTVFRPALVALGIGPGDEVILALHIATPNADLAVRRPFLSIAARRP
jgi:dTDP-4-amino-4,6-dideoxygalactose transaminase